MGTTIEVVVGPRQLADGSDAEFRGGKTGEGIVADAHGRYHEAVSRGYCYYATMQAGASLGTALTLTAVTITIYNPLGSTVRGSILFGQVAMTTVPVGAGTAIYVYAVNTNPIAAAPTATTALGVGFGNCLIGGPSGQLKAFTAATLPAIPSIARVIPGGMYWATAAGAACPIVFPDYVDGALELLPNTAVTIQAIGVATSGIASVMWEEIPIV